METSSFFAHFPALADAPNGVQRLRELILQLAVQGKLVPQDARDEPAAVLLAKIKAEKERLIREKKIRKSEPLPPIEADEKPQGWEVIRLGEIIELISGQHIEASEYDESGKGFAYLTGPADFGSVNPVITKWTRKPKVMACAQDILITVKGAGVGKLNILHCDDVTIGRQLMAIRCPLVSNRFIFYFLSSHLSHFQSESTGTTVPGLSREDIQHLVIGLPPLAEQRRIVAKVDQLMALCDELEARQQRQQTARVKLNNAALEGLLTARAPAEFAEHWQRICDNFDLLYDAPETVTKLRQAILQLAVQGKLVPQDAHDEPAATLLEKVKAEKERLTSIGKLKPQKLLTPNQHNDQLPFLPHSWRLVKLIDIAFLRSGIAVEVGDEMPEGDIPYVKVSDLNIERNSNGVVTSSRFLGSKYADAVIDRGSILFPKRGGAIATNRKRVTQTDIVCDSNLMAMKPMLNEMLPYLQLWFEGFDLWKLNSGTSVPQINNKDIYPLSIPLPPLTEQRRIVAKVDQLMALCDELEAKLRQAQTASAKLMTATVRHLVAA